MDNIKTITPQQLRQHWMNNDEIALIDVREEGPYSQAHPLFAITVPVSEIEAKIPSLVPRLTVPIVVYDDGEGYCERAVIRLGALDYNDIAILEGGLSAYAKVGEVYRDVNVPSKAFGELVEAIRRTPSLPAREVKEILDTNEDVVVLDSRRYGEYNTMSIPRGQSCPGGELVYRVAEAAPSPDTLVIVNCAGRTRSIIGTQSLINAGIPNKVVALRNGTIGWLLEGLELNHKAAQRTNEPSSDRLAQARQNSERWASHVGVPIINSAELHRFYNEADTRTLYMLDVRDPDEYAADHHPAFASAPGGQLVQATDEWVGVRGARIVLTDNDGVRARMTASWLLQLGWDVSVLETGSNITASLDPLPVPQMHLSWHNSITAEDLKNLSNATVVDLARSPTYAKGHIPGAMFASGPELARDLHTIPGDGPIVLTSPDGILAATNVDAAQDAVARRVRHLYGGTAAWVSAGFSLETDGVWLSEPIDVYKKPYEGTDNARSKMESYLEWEYGLIAQLANDGVSRFHVVRGDS